MGFQRSLASVLACSLLLSGCTSLKGIQPATAPGQPIYGPLKSGDTVIVQVRNGDRLKFEVDQIDGETIVARGGTRFTREDIVRLERRAFSAAKTAGLVAGIVGGFVLMLGIAVASAYDDLLSGR